MAVVTIDNASASDVTMPRSCQPPVTARPPPDCGTGSPARSPRWPPGAPVRSCCRRLPEPARRGPHSSRRAVTSPRAGELGRRCVPDRAADAAVGEGGELARPRARPRLRRRGRQRGFTASPSRTPGSRRRPAAGRTRLIRNARDRRRGASPRRGARLGRGVLDRVPSGRGWLLLSGTPFRSDAMPIPGVRYDARARRARRLLHVRRCDPRRDLPAGLLRRVRRYAVVAQRRRRDRVELRDGPDRARGAAATGPRSRQTYPTGCRGSSEKRTRS